METPLISTEKEPSSALTRLAGAARIDQYINATAANERLELRFKQLNACVQALKPLWMLVVRFVVWLLPFVLALGEKVYGLYLICPTNILKMMIGVGLCFFGGEYMMSIAAIEAFRTMGGMRVLPDLYLVVEQAKIAYAASSSETFEDLDAGITAKSATDLVLRKTKKGMAAVTEPEKLQASMGALWSAWMAVLATLRFEFAQIIALALGAADVLKFPTIRLLAPLLAWALGPDLKQWISTIIDTFIKIVVLWIAFYIQMVISAFYTGLRGGTMFAEGFFNVAEARGWLQKLPCIKLPFDPNESYLDEMIGYPVAALGFYWQVTSGFELPFPADLAFLPLTIIEYALRWVVATSSDPSATTAAGTTPVLFYA